jgi:hypothetical protein
MDNNARWWRQSKHPKNSQGIVFVGVIIAAGIATEVDMSYRSSRKHICIAIATLLIDLRKEFFL